MSPPTNNLIPFPYISIPKITREGKCKNGNKMIDSKITNVKPVDIVSAIKKLRTDKKFLMQRHNSLECIDEKQVELDWIGKKSLTKNYDNYKDDLFNMLS